jgi:hypothetical protein
MWLYFRAVAQFSGGLIISAPILLKWIMAPVSHRIENILGLERKSVPPNFFGYSLKAILK